MKVGTSDLLQIYARLGSPKPTAQCFGRFAATSNDSYIYNKYFFNMQRKSSFSCVRNLQDFCLPKAHTVSTTALLFSIPQHFGPEMAAAEPYFHAL